MSFGYSVGDFVAVTQLAWTVYKSCRDAPESFNNISTELLSFHAVLKEVEEIISEQPLSETRREHLATISNGCQCVLQDLQTLVKKYESLGSQSKRTWDRMKWGSNDIAELRARLTSNTVLLTAFMSTSQVVVERKLNRFVQEFQDGQREGTIKTVATIESLTLDDQQTWRTIRKELEDIGISVAAFDANKGFIMEWFQKGIETGAFEEQIQPATDDPESSNSDGIRTPSPHDFLSYSGVNAGPLQFNFPSETSPTVSPVSAAISQSSGEAHRSKPVQDQRADRSKPNKHPARPKRSRLLSAVAFVLRYDRSFYDACSRGDYTSARKLLEQGANINAVFDQGYAALGLAALVGKEDMAVWLLNNGANANVHGKYGYTPLYCAVENGSTDLVALLLEHGADIEGGGSSGTPLLVAAAQGRTEIAQQLLAHGAEVNPSRTIAGQTFLPLDRALMAGHDETAQLLIDSGAVTTMGEAKRQLLLLYAVQGSCQISLKILLERGVWDLEVKDSYGFTALDNAVRKDDLAMACSLLSAGAINNKSTIDKKARGTELLEGGIERIFAESSVEGYQRLTDFLRQSIIP